MKWAGGSINVIIGNRPLTVLDVVVKQADRGILEVSAYINETLVQPLMEPLGIINSTSRNMHGFRNVEIRPTSNDECFFVVKLGQ